jgi:hypothetical protein
VPTLWNLIRRVLPALPILAAAGIAILAALAPDLAPRGADEAPLADARIRAAIRAF